MLSTMQTKVLLVAILTVAITLYRFHQTTSSILQWQSLGSASSGFPVTAPSSSVSTNTMAPYLSPKDLMARPLPGPHAAIPKLFHQSWSSTELPAKFKKWAETCRRMHPDWEWVLWTDDDNRELVETFVPGMKEAYEGLRGPIFRADVVRNAYLFLFGG
jgi:mannosyltransferase OCH1-like enzyme